MRRLACIIALLPAWGACGPVGRAAEPAAPQPFAAVYVLKWHGFTAGHSTLTLSKTGAATYQYRSVNRARGLFRLAFPHPIIESSRFAIVGGQVRPLEYREVRGGNADNPDVSIKFDWRDRQVWGVQHGKPVNQPLEPGTEDPLSVQIALMRALAAGANPRRFLLFDQDRAKEYRYTRVGSARIKTALGALDTVIYRSDRPGSERAVTLWLAPGLGFLPVKAERRRKGDTDLKLEILRLTLEKGDPPRS